MANSVNHDAISEVIGIILILAITVILASIIAAMVFGMMGEPQKLKLVAVTVSQTGPMINIIYNAGGDDGSLRFLKISVPSNSTATTGPWYTDSPDGGSTGSNGADNPGNGLTTTPVSAPSPQHKPNIGAMYVLAGKGTGGQDRVIVVANFTDAPEQIVADTLV